MEIAIGIVFLALFAGAVFLLVLIAALFLWKRSKRNNSGQNRQFTSAETYGAVGGAVLENSSNDDNDYDFSAPVNYQDSSNENEESATAGMSFESSSEGGGYASESSDYSASSSDYSSGYDSSSSSDSSSGSSDSGSSSSSSD